MIHLADYAGVAVATYDYDAWGRIRSQSGWMADRNPLRYRGYYYDAETGFYYLQSRYYDPTLGRFINADSYASTGDGFIGYNMYAYCGNNPVFFGDHTGSDRIAIIYDDTFSSHNGFGFGGGAYALDYTYNHPFDEITICSYDNAEEFINCWNSLEGHYDEIIIFGHGSNNAPAIWFQDTNELIGLGSNCNYSYSLLKPLSVDNIELDICYAAKTFPDQSLPSTAQFFADLTGSTVKATEGRVNFLPLIRFTVTWLDEGYSWNYVLPKTWQPRKNTNPIVEALC